MGSDNLGLSTFYRFRKEFVELATQVSPAGRTFRFRYLSRPAGFLSYAPSLAGLYRNAAEYVDKIFKGAKPADLPVSAADHVRVGDQPENGEDIGTQRFRSRVLLARRPGDRMKRRAFCGAVGALLATPVVLGQPSAPMRRIAILEHGEKGLRDAQWKILEARLRELGYVEGKNLFIDRRWANSDNDRLPQLAQELLAGRPEVVLVTTTQGTRALMRLTGSVPIISVGTADPVATGLVASLARPGGNVTGISNLLSVTVIKRIELLREIIPKAKRFALLGPASDAGVQAVLKQAQDAVRPQGLELRLLDARDGPAIVRAFERLRAEPMDALVVASILFTHHSQIVELAARYRIPASYVQKEYLDEGGLIVFLPERDALYRHAADYVNRILEGAKPADMPVMQPAEFWLGVNLRTAQALGLNVPQSVLLRADRVIE